MNEQTGELNQLDRLVLANTGVFFKMMLDDEERARRVDSRFNAIETKLDIILEKLGEQSD